MLSSSPVFGVDGGEGAGLDGRVALVGGPVLLERPDHAVVAGLGGEQQGGVGAAGSAVRVGAFGKQGLREGGEPGYKTKETTGCCRHGWLSVTISSYNPE